MQDTAPTLNVARDAAIAAADCTERGIDLRNIAAAAAVYNWQGHSAPEQPARSARALAVTATEWVRMYSAVGG
jgi:hypothetical protein